MARILPPVLLSVMLLLGACATRPTVDPPEDPDVLLVDSGAEIAGDDHRTPDRIQRLASYHGLNLDADQVRRLQTAKDGDGAISAAEIQAILREGGLRVYVFHGEDDEGPLSIRYNLVRGRPLLVLLGSEGGKSAWILLVGYDDEDEVFVAQRADGTLEGWPYDVLREKWSAGGRMTLLAVPETTKARTESKP